MTDYVDREAIMRQFADRVRRSNNSDFAQTPTWNQAVQIVEDYPAADVAPVRHGEWKKVSVAELLDVFVCSACGWQTIDYGRYCPMCGAKMDGGEGE